MASFDSMAGKDLAGDWLHYYTSEDLLDTEGKPLKLRKYMGVDPAISLSANADRFVITVIGVADSNEVFLLEQYAARIPFAEQLLKIEEFYIKHKPQLIGIESNAYQAALVQQTERLTTMPPVVPLFAKGKKWERILAMSPLFRIGKVKIKKDHADFIQEWVDYDSAMQKPKDDCLDSMEIALRTAGALLEGIPAPVSPENPGGLPDWVISDRPSGSTNDRYIDEFMGSIW
jgi:predicted phage terminase large subunit-like protein